MPRVTVRLDGPADREGFRRAARRLMAQHQAKKQRNRQAQNRSKMGWED